MPIYEFYCEKCHTVFNFFSRTINTKTTPACPRCGRELARQVSAFATARRRGGDAEADDMGDLPLDESRMEQAIGALAEEAERINEDDPREAARLMRKFSKMAGMEFGEGMESAIERMEAGEDPEAVEADMGDSMENEDPFVLAGRKGGRDRGATPPHHDGKLYDL